MTCRIWPDAICSLSTSTAAPNSFDPHCGLEMSTPCSVMIRPRVSRYSSSTSTRPRSSGFHRSETVRRPPGTCSLFQAMPPKPGLPGQGVRTTRVEVDVLQLGAQVRRVRNLGLVQLLGVSHADHPAGHPVGEHDDVLADVLAVGELALDLAVVRVVAVDVLGVRGVDAGLLLERLEGRIGLGRLVVVEVERPVGPRDGLLRGGDVLCRRRPGRRGGCARRWRPAARARRAAGSEEGAEAEGARAAQHRPPGDPAPVVQGNQVPDLGRERRRRGSTRGHWCILRVRGVAIWPATAGAYGSRRRNSRVVYAIVDEIRVAGDTSQRITFADAPASPSLCP